MESKAKQWKSNGGNGKPLGDYSNYPPVLTSQQAADLLQVSLVTLYRWFKGGQLATCSAQRGRQIRILRDKLLSWFFEGTDAAEAELDQECRRYKIRRGITIVRRGKTWHGQFALRGSQRRRTLKTEDAATAAKRAVDLYERLTGKRKRRTAINAAIKAYLEFSRAERRSPKTLAKYECVLGRVKTLAAHEGLRRLQQIDVAFLDKYRRQRSAEGIAPKTLFNETTTIKQLMNFAVTRGMIKANSLRSYRQKKPKMKLQPFWSMEQVESILKAAEKSPYSDVYRVLAETGMRIGEVKFLMWDDVNLPQRVLYVREKQLDPATGTNWRPKTGEFRVVPLSPGMVELFSKQPHLHGPWVFGRTIRTGRRVQSEQINERIVLAQLKKALKQLGLPGHVHTFRHSFISHALIRGVPEALVRQWVGHVDPQTIRTYTHIADCDSHARIEGLFPSFGLLQATVPDYSI